VANRIQSNGQRSTGLNSFGFLGIVDNRLVILLEVKIVSLVRGVFMKNELGRRGHS
jgi:hypothetical protein